MGTAKTVKVPVKAPLEAVVYSKPIACSVYPPAHTCEPQVLRSTATPAIIEGLLHSPI